MNKSQLIGGIVCLVIAAFLAAVSLSLPPEKVWFLVGENNIPLAPIVVAVIGILLLVTARRGQEA
ncbi:MAG: hypothetical protein JSW55_07860 [Chloroflexota bacterium]|nr:MAG: hypothetical protein JSW55_07860 [Chloroflexota bacterium]